MQSQEHDSDNSDISGIGLDNVDSNTATKIIAQQTLQKADQTIQVSKQKLAELMDKNKYVVSRIDAHWALYLIDLWFTQQSELNNMIDNRLNYFGVRNPSSFNSAMLDLSSIQKMISERQKEILSKGNLHEKERIMLVLPSRQPSNVVLIEMLTRITVNNKIDPDLLTNQDIEFCVQVLLQWQRNQQAVSSSLKRLYSVNRAIPRPALKEQAKSSQPVVVAPKEDKELEEALKEE